MGPLDNHGRAVTASPFGILTSDRVDEVIGSIERRSVTGEATHDARHEVVSPAKVAYGSGLLTARKCPRVSKTFRFDPHRALAHRLRTRPASTGVSNTVDSDPSREIILARSGPLDMPDRVGFSRVVVPVAVGQGLVVALVVGFASMLFCSKATSPPTTPLHPSKPPR